MADDVRPTRKRTRLGRLSAEQSRMASEVYPRALDLAGRRAASVSPLLADRFIDVATDELILATRAYAGINGATFRTYASRRIALGLNGARRRPAPPERSWPAVESEEYSARADTEVDDADAFEAMIRQLPERYREVLTLHYRDGMTHEEIGGVCGIRAASVGAMKDRAIRWLREMMGGEDRLAS